MTQSFKKPEANHNMRHIKTDAMLRSDGHYAQCIEHAGTLYISGQLPIDPTTKSAPERIQDQTTLALSKIEAIVKEAGCRKENILQVRVYLVGIDHWDTVNDVYSGFFGDHKPARCIVPVPELHFGCLVEIEAIAAIGTAKV